MMKRFLFVLFITAAACSLSAAVKIDSNGTINCAGFKIRAICANKRWAWRDNARLQDVKPQKKGKDFSTSGSCFVGGSTVNMFFDIKQGKDKFYQADCKMTIAPAQDIARCLWSFDFDIFDSDITVDGKAVKVKPGSKKGIVFHKVADRIVARTTDNCEIDIRVDGARVMVEYGGGKDNRKAALSILFNSCTGNLAECSGSLKFREIPIEFTTVDLKNFVNRSTVDTRENPGWTNQGYGHDMAAFRGGKPAYGGVPFKTVLHKAVTVGGERRLGTVRSAGVMLPDNNAQAIHLLHNSAWTSGDFGRMTVNFKNGKTQDFILNSLRDGGDWTQNTSRPNGLAVWTGKGINGSNRGMFLSVYALKYKAPVKVTFTALTQNIYWAINGITLGSKKRIIPTEMTVLREARHGKDWNNLAFANHTIKGSAMDFSFMLDAPAGKYGRVLAAPDGTFRFANGKRLKLFGPNVCHTMSTLDSKEYIDKLADQLASTGYNCVRVHFAAEGEVYDKNDPNKINYDKLDKLDYLFYALKKRGIYYTTDLWAGKRLKNLNNINVNVAFVFDKELRKEWENNARLIFLRKNPYTGMSLAEDPALVFSNLMNEDNVMVHWNNSRETRELVLKCFKKYIEENNLKNTVAGPENPAFMDFLIRSQIKAHAEMIKFVREELKTPLPLTSLNFHNEAYLTPMREQYDCVDTHYYISHPIFSGKPWYSPRFYHIECSTWNMAYLARIMFMRRYFGKPFVVTEYNVCKPNFYRAECAPQMGSYSALQDWDAIYRFCYSHSRRRVQKCMYAIDDFEVVADPVKQLGERLTSVMFLRGDVKAAPKRYIWKYSRDTVKNGGSYYYPLDMSYLGLVQQVGTAVAEGKVDKDIRDINGTDFTQADAADAAQWKSAAKKGVVRSSTGEIDLDVNKKFFRTVTPKTESLLLEKGALKGKVLEVSGVDIFQNVAIMSVDNKPLKTSKRMLLIHLTDITNTGSKVEFTGTRASTKFLGRLPLLVRNAKSKVTLNLPAKGLKVYALSADGARLGEVKCVKSADKLTFTANTAMFKEGVMAYEVERK